MKLEKYKKHAIVLTLATFIFLPIAKENIRAAASVQPKDLKRILSNLLNNSVEASNDGGRIRVSTDTDGEFCVIEVTDEGAGIPKDVIGKIGTKGFSFGKSNGNGLGLSNAISVVESWGRRVEITSNFSQGTSVTLRLPIA